MPDFRAKCTKSRFRLGLRPRSRWGSLQRSPDPLAGFEGPTSKGKGREGERRRGEGGGEEGMGGEGREKEGRRKGKGEDDCYSKLFLGPGW